MSSMIDVGFVKINTKRLCMKNIKEHKGQILAVLALGLALGLAGMPGATFATDATMAGVEAPAVESSELDTPEVVDEEGIMPLNVETGDGVETEDGEAGLSEGAGTGSGANEGEEAISQDVAENLVELNGRIQERDTFAGYRKAAAMARNAVALDAMSAKVENIADVALTVDWEKVSEEEKNALVGKTLLEAVQYIKTLPVYESDANTKKQVDDILTKVGTATTNLRAEVKELLPATPNIDTLSMEELVKVAKTYPNFTKIAKLAMAMTKIDVLNAGLTAGAELTAAQVEAAYGNSDAEMMKAYNAIAVAALEFDDTVMKGLMSYELPNTSVGTEEKPSTPNTGSLDATETGALDLALISTIAAGSLALAGGAALVAKLYLCHKF